MEDKNFDRITYIALAIFFGAIILAAVVATHFIRKWW